jgi:hypothetical protein
MNYEWAAFIILTMVSGKAWLYCELPVIRCSRALPVPFYGKCLENFYATDN